MLGAKKPASVTPMITRALVPVLPSMKENSRPPANPPIAPTTLPLSTLSTVQPAGLPAKSSLRRMRSALSAPDRRRPIPVNRFCRGTRTRSLNDLSSSRVSSLGAVVIASMSSSDRATPELGAALRIAEPTRMREVNTRRAPMMKSIVMTQTSTFTMRDIQNAPTMRIAAPPPIIIHPSGRVNSTLT